MTTLHDTIIEIRKRIERSAKRRLNEQNTKATLIEPVMRALQWDVEDIDEVVREFRLKKRDKPVDYGLLVLRTPRLFIEAKALGENLDDRRWANQIMGYASVAGVEWIVLTDGNEYRIYNTHAPVSVDQKLFRTIRLTDDDPLVEPTLELLAKDRMEENRIEVLWRSHFVDRQVHGALEQLFSPDNDMLLVNHVARHTKNLTTQEIRSSIARCQVTLDFPIQTDVPEAKTTRKRKPQKPRSGSPASYEVSVQDLISAGLLNPPTAIERTYKGQLLTGKIERDGQIKFGRDHFASLSTAAGAARASVIGLREDGNYPHTNGWTFWRVKVTDGKQIPLSDLRDRLLKQGDSEAAG